VHAKLLMGGTQDKAAALKQEERDHGKGRRWRGQLRKPNALVSLLEEDQDKLEKVYPQVDVVSSNLTVHLSEGQQGSSSCRWCDLKLRTWRAAGK